MQIETVPTKRTIKEKYSVIERDTTALIKRIDPKDLITLLDKYAKDVNFNLSNVADALNISSHGLEILLKKEGVQEYYQSCKRKRGEAFAVTGFNVVMTPYEKILNGEEVSPFLNNAAKNLSNYCLAMAKSMNGEYNPDKRQSEGGGGVKVVVNTGIQLNV